MEKYTRTVLNEYKESIMFKCYLQNKYFLLAMIAVHLSYL